MLKSRVTFKKTIDTHLKKGQEDNNCLPPMTQDQLDNLTDCYLTNPKVGKSHGIKIPKDFNIIDSALEILKVRLEVQKGMFPYWFMEKYYPFKGSFPRMIPKALENIGLSFSDPQKLADIVHMDFPSDAPKAVLKWLLAEEKVNINEHTPKYKQFLESVPQMELKIAQAFNDALDDVFEVKSQYLLGRPEEILERLLGITGPLFTAYKDGCPTHGAFPQGHLGAIIKSILAIIENMDISPMQKKILLDIAYMWGMFRCLAGVHYGIDGIGSLVLLGAAKYMKPEIVAKYKIIDYKPMAA